MQDKMNLLTAREAADELRVSLSTVWQFIRDGKLLVVRAGAKVLVPRSEIDRWIASASPHQPRPRHTATA